MDDPQHDIVELEEEIDALAESAEKCRKTMIVARLAIAAGIVLVALLWLGFVRPDGFLLVVGFTAVVAGIGIFGSHRSTLDQLKETIAQAEARRAQLIDAMHLKAID